MKKWPDEKNQLDKIEQRIIDLAHQQTLLLSLDNKEIFKLLEKAEAENKTLTEQNKLMREALGEIIAKATIEVAMTPAAFPDFYQGYKEGLVKAGEIAQDALTAIKGEPI